jgi:DNA-binding YbaB/EbfC family protein
MAEDMGNMLEQLQHLQEQMARVQQELGSLTVSAESGGGMIKVTANGRQQIVKVEIEKEVIDPNDPEMLEDLIVAAVNRALDHARELSESRLGDAARSMLPPGFPPIV